MIALLDKSYNAVLLKVIRLVPFQKYNILNDFFDLRIHLFRPARNEIMFSSKRFLFESGVKNDPVERKHIIRVLEGKEIYHSLGTD